jgi:hypothetical protein
MCVQMTLSNYANICIFVQIQIHSVEILNYKDAGCGNRVKMIYELYPQFLKQGGIVNKYNW